MANSGIETTLTLTQLRVIKNIKQSTLRDMLDLSDRAFRLKEQGKNEFTFSQIRKIAEFYNLSLDDMAKIIDNTITFENAKETNTQE